MNAKGARNNKQLTSKGFDRQPEHWKLVFFCHLSHSHMHACTHTAHRKWRVCMHFTHVTWINFDIIIWNVYIYINEYGSLLKANTLHSALHFEMGFSVFHRRRIFSNMRLTFPPKWDADIKAASKPNQPEDMST